jgi:hypothetical protein
MIMALKLATPPAEALPAVASALDRLQARTMDSLGGGGAAIGPRALAIAERNTMNSSVPHPVYQLTLEDLVEDRGLEAARRVGWRYLLEDGSKQVLGFAETDDSGGGVQLRALNTGRFGQATRDAVESAEHLGFVSADDFEVRVLRVPALSLSALWLASETAEDALVPLGPTPAEISTGVPARATDLIEKLRPLARKRLGFRE